MEPPASAEWASLSQPALSAANSPSGVIPEPTVDGVELVDGETKLPSFLQLEELRAERDELEAILAQLGDESSDDNLEDTPGLTSDETPPTREPPWNVLLMEDDESDDDMYHDMLERPGLIGPDEDPPWLNMDDMYFLPPRVHIPSTICFRQPLRKLLPLEVDAAEEASQIVSDTMKRAAKIANLQDFALEFGIPMAAGDAYDALKARNPPRIPAPLLPPSPPQHPYSTPHPFPHRSLNLTCHCRRRTTPGTSMRRRTR